MPDLRSRCLTAMGQCHYDEDKLDALLGVLAEHADEWSEAEYEYHKKIGWENAWHSQHTDELQHLLAVLKPTTEEARE